MVSGFPYAVELFCSRFWREWQRFSTISPPRRTRPEMTISQVTARPVPARLGSDNGWRTKNLRGRALATRTRSEDAPHVSKGQRLAKQKRAGKLPLSFTVLSHSESIGSIFCCVASVSLGKAAVRQNPLACSFGLLFVQTFMTSALSLPIVPFARAKSSYVQLLRESASAFSVSLVYPCDGVRLRCQSLG
jgi:hypothetical protein